MVDEVIQMPLNCRTSEFEYNASTIEGLFWEACGDDGLKLNKNKSLKCVVVACMSKRCSKCEAKKEHLPEFCSKNYEGSSKGMEATGALRNFLNLFDSLDVYVREFVMDDDASRKTILKHSYKTLLDAGFFDMVDWPKNKDGRKK
jgi:hypothetical protein